MTKRIILLALCSLLLAPCSAAQAQQRIDVAKIGWLGARSFGSDERQRSGVILCRVQQTRVRRRQEHNNRVSLCCRPIRACVQS
jgi:hypothetical protein